MPLIVVMGKQHNLIGLFGPVSCRMQHPGAGWRATILAEMPLSIFDMIQTRYTVRSELDVRR